MLTLLPFLVTVITKSQYKFGTLRLIVNLPPPTIIKKQQPINDAAVLVVFSLHPCKPYKTTTDDQDLLYWPDDLPIRDYHQTRIIIPDQEQKADTLITVHIFSTPSTNCFLRRSRAQIHRSDQILFVLLRHLHGFILTPQTKQRQHRQIQKWARYILSKSSCCCGAWMNLLYYLLSLPAEQ